MKNIEICTETEEVEAAGAVDSEHSEIQDPSAPPHMLSLEEKLSKYSWYYFNPHFGWIKRSEFNIKGVKASILQSERNPRGKIHCVGAGHREPQRDLSTWDEGIFD